MRREPQVYRLIGDFTTYGRYFPMASMLEEKEAIRDLMSAYCFYVDNCEFEKFADLFTEDAQFEAGPLGKLCGREAIREFIAGSIPNRGEGPARKHCTLNHLINVSGASARADSYIIVLREADNGIIASLAGRYEDVLVKQNGEWRFKVRKIHFDISGDLGLKK
ncbi:MAG: nuclear transport factor 2 family protein [Candidatus Binataceae bacterium]